MRRLPDWRERLMGYVHDMARQRFAYGVNDCALFAAGAVAAMTGQDPAAAWRGQYSDDARGRELLRAAGFDSPAAAADALFDRVAVSFAQVGDLALVEGPAGPAMGVVQGEMIYVLTPHGLGGVDLLRAVTAWRV